MFFLTLCSESAICLHLMVLVLLKVGWRYGGGGLLPGAFICLDYQFCGYDDARVVIIELRCGESCKKHFHLISGSARFQPRGKSSQLNSSSYQQSKIQVGLLINLQGFFSSSSSSF